jgi:predicted transcriptional regulator
LMARENLQEERGGLLSALQRICDDLAEIEKNLGIGPQEVRNRVCSECARKTTRARIYVVDQFHYLDGDKSNKLHSNRAIICPRCQTHILLSALDPVDMWQLKSRGMSNQEIADRFGVTRERVRTLLKRYKPPKYDIDIEWTIQGIQSEERQQGKKRVTDKRTLKKRVLRQLKKQHRKT